MSDHKAVTEKGSKYVFYSETQMSYSSFVHYVRYLRFHRTYCVCINLFIFQEEALEWANDGYKQIVSFNYGFSDTKRM
jgi:hypothetical protein